MRNRSPGVIGRPLFGKRTPAHPPLTLELAPFGRPLLAGHSGRTPVHTMAHAAVSARRLALRLFCSAGASLSHWLYFLTPSGIVNTGFVPRKKKDSGFGVA